MRTAAILAGVSALTANVAGHATFQQFWVNGEDQGTTCARLPTTNSPIASVTSEEIRCNANNGPAESKCPVAAGDTVTVEMHQHNTRDCSQEAIGGAHYGPVLVYMSKVEDAAAADGSDPWFKVFQDTWAKASDASQGSDDYWGTKDLNNNCGKMDVKIPADLAPGDYLLRAEAIALHAAGSPGGAQPYVTCYQISVTGSGTRTPEGVAFPGAYDPADPGLQINIYQAMSEYVAPGPAVIVGGTELEAGSNNTISEPTGDASQPSATGGASQPSATGAAPASSQAPVSAAPSATPTAVEAAASSTLATVAQPTASAPAQEETPEQGSGSDVPETFTLDTFIAWLQQQ
ncbi:putative cellulose binding protein [Corynespora cassiicola Philippines]|uniref:AA9 family lytic polysaccharide monooxygenase n=1 Tax=Corynespora cassiicola Philippines TaxID=1448308 RepID=A0A2T2NHG5_CORCC|nr:putative cellulose binding protein [Corynespora cassiicola Philippines]